MMTSDVARRSDLALAAPLRWGTDGVSTPEQAFVLPVGTVTFLLTDIAGSTQLWEHEPQDTMQAAVVRHYAILAAAVEAHRGVRPQEQGEGDSVVAAFARPSDALAAASAAQLALAAEPWGTSQPLRVRIAVHTGEAHLRDDANYAGQAIIRTARLRNIGHGGQVLVSGATRDLSVDQTGTRFELVSLGEHRLRDLGRPEHVWQLVHPDLPSDFDDLVTLDTVPNSLPISLSPFIGRHAEILALSDLVWAERLVTCTGTGGAGKTRLALHVGAELVEQFPAGVWWVELAPLGPDGVESAMRASLGISEGAQVAFEEAVRRKLGDQRCLLIVDNCEHVTEVVAPLVDRLLRSAPTLHVLATSRVMLDLPGERSWRVPPLGLPDRSATATVEALSQFDAVRLFCDRARRARPNFDLTIDNGPVVAELCHRLDGIPLAIELAAARCRMLDPQRILDGLDDAFRILAGGSRAVLPRQQTLEGSIAWSHDLLAPRERTLLRRLSIFVDGWTLDTAEAVAPDGDVDIDVDGLDALAVFDALDRLVDHSLVHTVETPTGVRFGMLETVRQFATRRLADDPGEQSDIADRHAEFFADWVASLRDDLLGAALEQWYDPLVAERSNIVAALSRRADADPAASADALMALAAVLAHDEWAATGRSLLPVADRLDATVDAGRRWQVLWARTRILSHLGDPTNEMAYATAMHDAAAAVDDPVGIALAKSLTLSHLAALGWVVFDDWKGFVAMAAPHDPAAAAALRSILVFFAAQHGRIDLVDETMAEIELHREDHGLPLARTIEMMADGNASFHRADARRAVDLMRTALASRFTIPSLRGAAAGVIVQAGADLGLDLAAEVEPGLRAPADVEGNLIAGITADEVLAIQCLHLGDTAGAHERYRRLLDAYPAVGDTIYFAQEVYTLIAAGFEGYEDCLTTESSPTVVACGHRARAEQALRRGDVASALDRAHQALRIEHAERLDRGRMFTLDCISRVLTAAGRHHEAARILGACESARAQRGLVRLPCLQALMDESTATTQAALGDDAFEVALADGATLSLVAVTEYSTRLRVAHTAATVGWDALTPTEARVAELVAEGLTNPQVAKELLMGAETVKTHLSRVFDKIGVANRKELIVAGSRRAAERHR